MYEPKRIPSLDAKTAPLPEIRYGIKKSNQFVDLEDPTIDPLHIHGYLEIFFSISAEVSFLVNDTLDPVSRGDALISRPNDVHVCIFPRSDAYEYYCLWIDADFSLPFFDFIRKSDASPLFSLGTEKAATFEAWLERLEALQSGERNATLEISLLFSILAELNADREEQAPAASLPMPLSDVLLYINGSFTEICSVSDLARRFFISTATLNRRFRTHLHTTPREYIEAQKLSYAIELLKKGASVTEAATTAGFSDCSHFIVLFKKKFGETPLQYKKRMQTQK